MRSGLAVTGNGEPGGTRQGGRGVDGDADGPLLAACARGDQAAFRQLVTRHVGAVRLVALRMLNDWAEADDVAQEAMLRLWRQRGDLVVDGSGVRPWLKRVAINLCIDRIRVRNRTDLVDEVPEQPEAAGQLEALESRERSARVAEALARLPDRQRQALTLFHYEGMSQDEVAAALGVSAEAVESLLARARRSLRQSLQEEWRELVGGES